MGRRTFVALAFVLAASAIPTSAAELSEAGMRRLLRDAQADDPDDPCLPHSFAAFKEEFRGAYEELIHKCELDVRIKALGPEHVSVGWALERLGYAYRNERHDPTTAVVFLERAVAHKERVQGPEAASLLTALETLGWAYRDLERFADAEAVLRRALVLRERDTPRWTLAGPLYVLGTVVLAQHRNEEAEKLFRRSIEAWEEAHPPIASDLTFPLNGLATALLAQGKLAEVDKVLKRVTKIFDERGLPPNHWTRAESLKTLAALREAQKRPGAAEALKRQLLAIEFATSKPRASLEPMPWQGLSTSAWDVFDGILHMVENVRGKEHPDIVPHLYVFGYAMQQDKRVEETERCYKRALAIREKTLVGDSPKVAASLDVLASLYHSLDRLEEAESLRSRARAVRNRTQ